MATRKGGLFLALFGSVFLTVGAVCGFLSLRTLLRAERMLGWRQVPATVASCDLRVSRGSKGGSTYKAEASYRYEVEGRTYTGNRVSLHSGSDNVGTFHQRVHAELRRHMTSGTPTVCWVDPANPAEAILYPRPRPEMLAFMQFFVLMFGGAGVAIVLTGLTAFVQSFSRQDREDAAHGTIRMRGTSAHLAAGAVALAWNAYTGFFVWKTCAVLTVAGVPWFIWLVGATGVLPALAAGYLIGRYRKFGVSMLDLSPMPAVLGRPLAGTVRVPAKVDTEKGFDVALRCVHQYTSRSGKNSTTHKHTLWEGTQHLDAAHAYGEETMLPVRFTLPEERPATSAAGGQNGYYWQMTVTAAAPGIDYKAVFDVPVRRA